MEREGERENVCEREREREREGERERELNILYCGHNVVCTERRGSVESKMGREGGREGKRE